MWWVISLLPKSDESFYCMFVLATWAWPLRNQWWQSFQLLYELYRCDSSKVLIPFCPFRSAHTMKIYLHRWFYSINTENTLIKEDLKIIEPVLRWRREATLNNEHRAKYGKKMTSFVENSHHFSMSAFQHQSALVKPVRESWRLNLLVSTDRQLLYTSD